jgi:hypothetical protein
MLGLPSSLIAFGSGEMSGLGPFGSVGGLGGIGKT